MEGTQSIYIDGYKAVETEALAKVVQQATLKVKDNASQRDRAPADVATREMHKRFEREIAKKKKKIQFNRSISPPNAVTSVVN